MYRRNHKKLIFPLLALIALILLFSSSKLFIETRIRFLNLFSLPSGWLQNPFREIKNIANYRRTISENRLMKNELKLLESRLIGLEELIKANNRLEKLLEFKRNLIKPSVAANVIGRDPSRWNSVVVIDKGSRDGVKVGMGVVNSSGIIGKVAETEKNLSKVMLLTDPQFSVAALAQESRKSGLISGTLQGLCRMRYIKELGGIKIGDKIVTSKLSNAFPEGLLVGEVAQVNITPDTNEVECIIRPGVSLSELEEVLVIK
ncbi:MAG: rod shape-determining protein MreC [Candidatus Omnitrophica bacterium]|nr:rod shape-determining protein MreC [Candidatus Omnitrophota bacterium]